MTTDLVPFEHQTWAIEKLKGVASIGFFDDMGVGKTVEAILMDRIRRKADWPNPKTLVVTLAGAMVDSWARHFALWAPELKVVTLDPKKREFSWEQFTLSNADVFIVHWEAVRLMPQLTSLTWLHIIADECHRISDRKTQMTKAFKKIKAGFKTGLSGTPTTGAPHMLWSIFNWMYPRKYTSYWRFYDTYLYWEMDKSGRYRKIIGVNEKNIVELQKEMNEFSVRRMLRDVRKDMPDRMPPEELYVDLLPIQRRAYNQMKEDMIAWVENQSAKADSDDVDPVVAQAAVSKIIRLLQFASAYAQIDDQGNVRLSEPSSKLDAVMDAKIIPAIDQGVKLVVFSDFRQLIELLNARLDKAKIPYATIHGNVAQRDRVGQVDYFQTGAAMVATITQAGGAGIDLFAGSRFVFLTRHWSPGVNDQAISRIDRIGQTQAIQVTDIISRSTFDTEKLDTVAMKYSWMRKVLGS